MNKKLTGLAVVVIVAAALPFALVARSRSHTSPTPPLHLVLDMDKQPAFRTQRPNAMFADGRAMRMPVPGTAARDDLAALATLATPATPAALAALPPSARGGKAGAASPGSLVAFDSPAAYDRVVHGVEAKSDGKSGFVTEMPVPVTMDLLRRGQDRYRVYCSSCHGLDGSGEGMVSRRAAEMQAAGSDSAAGWVTPANYHTDELRGRNVGQLYSAVTQGVRTMPPHGRQIPVADRWAIVAYVKALQRSQHAKAEDVPASEAGAFAR